MIDSVSDELNNWFKYGINLEQRIIYLPEGSGEDGLIAEDANHFVKTLLYLSNKTKHTIYLYINCLGGCTKAGMTICDAISLIPNPVVGVVTGEASSMAAWILQFCNQRMMWPSSSLLVHYGTVGAELDPRHIGQFAKLTKQEEKKFEDILLTRIREKHPTYSVRRLRSLLGKDHPLSAVEAIELGLADCVVEPLIVFNNKRN